MLGAVAMKGEVVQWSSYVAYFFGGVFLVNSIPHLTSGVSGHRLPTPFASPLGKGDSSPTVNVLYGSVNLAVGYLLVCQVGDFQVRRISDVLVLGAGGLLMAVMLSQLFVYLQRSMGGRDGLVAAQATFRWSSRPKTLVRRNRDLYCPWDEDRRHQRASCSTQ